MATVTHREKQPQQEPQEISGLPDLVYIRKYVPIEEIATDFFGFDVRNHTMRCFRPENHQNGDRTPSFQFYPDNRAQCFCCDAHAYSNIDFVMKVRGYDTPSEAIRWICLRFPNVPRARVGRPRGSSRRESNVHVGIYGGQLETTVRSGLFAKLSTPATRLLTVLVAVQDEHGQVDWSYAALLRVTGIGSSASLKKALVELNDLHAISIKKVARSDGPGSRNVYKLTLEHPEFVAYLDATRRALWHDVEQDREAKAASRKLRSHVAKIHF